MGMRVLDYLGFPKYADMIAYPRHITPAYRFEEMEIKWRAGPLLGIEPNLLKDYRIGRAMSMIGSNAEYFKEVLFNMVITAVKNPEIPLSTFILDTMLLELDGYFKNAAKIRTGRGTDFFSQLKVSLVIASRSRIPVGFGVLPGNTSDLSTLPDIFGCAT